MNGNRIRLAALGLGLAVILPASPVFAAPQLGPDWVLVETRKVKQFVAAPPKLGKGKWKVRAVRDRRYFVPEGRVEAAEESILESSKVLEEEVERANEAHVLEKIAGEPSLAEAIYEVAGEKSTAARTTGRTIERVEITAINRVKEVVKTTPYQIYDTVTWDERTRKTLANVYAVKRGLAFNDPKTGQRLQARAQRLEKPVVEIAVGKWQSKSLRQKGAAGKDVTRTASVLGTRLDEKLLSTRLIAALDVSSEGAAGVLKGLASSTGSAKGAGEARFAGDAGRLSGAENARSEGDGGFDFELLKRAARAGATFVDDAGFAWKLGTDGPAILFTPEGGPTATLRPGSRQAKEGDVEVRVEMAHNRDGQLLLAGRFKRDDSHQAWTLRSR